MPSSTVIRDYLVTLGWDIKHEQLKKFDEALIRTGKVLETFSKALSIGAAAVAHNVMGTAEQLDRLYFAAQRIGTTAFNLQQFSYAAQQIGVSGEEIQGAISAIGVALRTPGRMEFLRTLNVQSNDAAEALKQLLSRLQSMPYYMGVQYAKQFGISEQAYFQLRTRGNEMMREYEDRARRIRGAGNDPNAAKDFNTLMTEWRRLLDEVAVVEQKVGEALVKPMTEAVRLAERLLEEFAKLDKTTISIVATLALGFGSLGVLRLGGGLVRGLLGLGSGAAARGAIAAGGTAVGGAAAGGASSAALGAGARAALGMGAIAGLGATAFIQDRNLSPAAIANRRAAWGWLGGNVRGAIGQPGASPGFSGHHETPVHDWFSQTMLGSWLHSRRRNPALRDWVQGSVLHGGVDMARDPSTALRDWLHGSSSFVPKVQLIQGTSGSGPAGSGSGFWGWLSGASSAVGRAASGIAGAFSGGAHRGAQAAPMSFGAIGRGGAALPSTPVSTVVPPEARGLLMALAARESEGAAKRLGVSPYNVRYSPGGGAAFNDLSAHPQIYEPGPSGPSSAAGRYQFVWSTWNQWANRLGLRDFKPESQDKAAWADAQDIYQRAVGRDLAGDLRNHTFDSRAVSAFRREWSSVGSDLPTLIEKFGGVRPAGERRLPPGTPYNSNGEPYSRDLLTMSKGEAATMRRRVSQWGAANQRQDKLFFTPTDELMKNYPDLLENRQKLLGKDANTPLRGDSGDRESHNTINQTNHFEVSGFNAADVGREAVRHLDRGNADLIRNLGGAVG